MKHFISSLFLYFFLLIVSFPVYCQLNIRVGYALSKLNSKEYNHLVGDFNKTSGGQPAMKEINYLNGIQLGFQYEFERFSLGVGWAYGLKTNKSEYKDPASGNLENARMDLIWQSYGLNIESKWDWFGLGIEASYDVLRSSWKKVADADKMTILEQKGLGSKVFSNLYLQGSGRLGVIIQPFFAILWPGINLNPMRQWAGTSSSNANWNAYRWGISLYFNNGSK